MKLTCLLLMIFIFQSNADTLAQTLTLKKDKATLREIFKDIQHQTGYSVIYNVQYIKDIPPISVAFDQEPLASALHKILTNSGIGFVIVNKEIVIKTKKPTASAVNSLAVQPSLSGGIYDGDGKPLVGAAVQVIGTPQGTSTDQNGHFLLKNVPSTSTLRISHIGYESLEIKATADLGHIVLKMSDAKLEEVVVIGYGSLRKSDVTGSVVSLSPKDLNTVNSISADQLLQGRAPGVQITQSSHAPGGGSTIRIRGIGSINAGNEPLYVIDGVPIDNRATANSKGSSSFSGDMPPANPLNIVNAADIASIEILKDASATAIYGSRGANGVILITTKTGGGAFMANFNSNYGLTQIARKMDVLSTKDYIQVMNDLARDRGEKPVFDQDFITSVGKGTDWQKALFKNGHNENHNLSLSGGVGKSNYYSSLGYTNQVGIIPNTKYQRLQGRLNFEHTVSDKFKFGFNVNTSQENNYSVPVNGFSINQDADAINSALNTPPIFPIYYPDGTFYRPESGEPVSVTLDNPLAIVEGQKATDRINRTLANFFGEYELIPGLKARLNIGSDRSNKRRDLYLSRISQVGNAVDGSASVQSGDLNNILVEALLKYNRTIREKHSLNVLAGATVQQFDERTVGVGTKGFASDVIGSDNLGLGTIEFNTAGSYFGRRRLLSYLGRVNYGYQNKYLFTGTIRADGSSNFGINNRFGIFPSFSAAWNLSEEDFLKQAPTVSSLKLRVGWGQIGNDDIGIGTGLTTYSGSGNVVLGGALQTAISPARIPNPNLKWETSQQTNIGLDFGFWGSRLSGSIDYFIKTNKDLLFNLPIPSSSGFAVYTENIGKISNKGIELYLSSENLTGNFNWRSTFNVTKITNKVDDLGGISEYVPSNEPTTLVRPGEALFSYFGYRSVGIFQTAAEASASAQPNAKPGDPKWDDVNGDGVINERDRVVLGNPYPDVTLGLSNDFSYKNFALTIFFEGAFGADLFHWQTVDALYANDPYRNRMATPLLNRWTPENPGNTWPSGVSIAQLQYSKTNSYTILDASYIRLKNVQLSYQIPIKNTKTIKGLRVSLSGQNLALITDYPGFDPDVNATGTGNIRYDRNAYPASRTYMLGLNLNF
ncbi:TonB-dependent receptor [Olivibacter domesticus]|uniref:TonB-linked outer membrane protein, SusC/RagA family n=1 Tax=Olivibacter domesticus TaxID=407022 RepID=A0A1H7JKM4_OLID1|nr:TonB-dependent receptor [Olivibacter domesticus]SEK75169.1 TonB-linked outer membrane protein, SusC/RagA family [Olivibacter domesticus]